MMTPTCLAADVGRQDDYSTHNIYFFELLYDSNSTTASFTKLLVLFFLYIFSMVTIIFLYDPQIYTAYCKFMRYSKRSTQMKSNETVLARLARKNS